MEAHWGLSNVIISFVFTRAMWEGEQDVLESMEWHCKPSELWDRRKDSGMALGILASCLFQFH